MTTKINIISLILLLSFLSVFSQKGEAQINKREQNREQAKNKRISQQSSEQSRLIDQRKNNLPPINFESNEDSLDGFDMAEFNPK